jgi:oxygen-independent coproporphyrinogen-3 oxidase
MVAALVQEIRLQSHYLENKPVSTIYFGGGTPSLLTAEELQDLLQTIYTLYVVNANAEITLEANPDDITPEKLNSWNQIGINRLSIGIQSFFEEELVWMNRAHTNNQAHQCIEWSLAAGFHNITIDLIYGSPLLSDEMWEQNVKKAIAYGIPHLSCYALTVEEKTPLHKHIDLKRKADVDPDKQGHQFLLLMQWLKAEGYEHYEVSNFAKPGFRSRHNSAYWKGQPYLGIGPSAHSFNGSERQWNIANNKQYMHSIQQDLVPFEKELLSPTDQLNEFLMISLRTKEGIDLARLSHQWGWKEKERVVKETIHFINNGVMIREENQLRLTESGMPLADGIASQLFKLDAS